ncbi:bifunctional diaminohydroxyphosphoribosylaminopyrimidine deaminase/5-amino-6-(5-phosphoribosylamino)uracil reductase RibD [bacterium]
MTFNKQDKEYMKQAFELAILGKGKVEPNPMVGAVLVNNREVIGKGHHSSFGGLHAEIEAINSCKNKDLLKNAVLYVTLEPCCHYGKTPPCTDAIIKAGIKRVVIAVQDPNPLVRGKGIETLRKSGIKVDTGCLQEQAKKIIVG